MKNNFYFTYIRSGNARDDMCGDIEKGLNPIKKIAINEIRLS